MNNRRRFLFGAAALLAAPAIARASSLMLPISDWSRLPLYWGDGVHDDTPYLQAALDKLAPGHNMAFAARPHYTFTPLDFSRCRGNAIDFRDCFEGTVHIKGDLGVYNYINLSRSPTAIISTLDATITLDETVVAQGMIDLPRIPALS